MQRYKVIGPAAVAGVAPGGEVTREQVEAFVGTGDLHFEVLVGAHLEPVADEPKPDAPAKKALK